MHKIMVLADPLSAALFMLTDFEVVAVQEPDTVPHLLQEVLSRKYEIVFITEVLAAPLRQQLREAQETTDTILTVIPGAGASGQIGKEMLLALKKSVVGR